MSNSNKNLVLIPFELQVTHAPLYEGIISHSQINIAGE